MNPRAFLSAGLALGALTVGLATSWVAAENHRLARELDHRQRACDALEVWNASLAFEVLAAEEQLIADTAAEIEQGAHAEPAAGALPSAAALEGAQ